MPDECKNESTAESTADRRDFLKLVGVAGAAISSLSLSEAASAEMPADHKGHSPVTAGGSRAISAGYRVFNINEVAFVESAVDILISADPVGPALPSWAWRPISIGKWPEATARAIGCIWKVHSTRQRHNKDINCR